MSDDILNPGDAADSKALQSELRSLVPKLRDVLAAAERNVAASNQSLARSEQILARSETRAGGRSLRDTLNPPPAAGAASPSAEIRALDALRQRHMAYADAARASSLTTDQFAARLLHAQRIGEGGGGVPPTATPRPARAGGLGGVLAGDGDARRVTTFDQAVQRSTASVTASSQALRDGRVSMGAFIDGAVKGETTMRDLGRVAVDTVGKMALWSAGAAALYGALGALKQVGTGAKQAQAGVQTLARFIPNVDADKAQQGFREVSQKFNVPIEDVANTQAGFLRVYQDQSQSLAAASVSLKATKLDQIGAADSLRYFTAIIQGFHLPAARLPGLFDQITQAYRKLGAPIRDILPGFARSAAAVALGGGDENQLLAIIGAIKRGQGGLTGNVIGTGIQRAVTTFIPKNAEAIAKLGLDPHESSTQLLIDAVKKAQSLKPAQVQDLAKLLFGSQYGARVGVGFLSQPTILDKFIKGTSADSSKGASDQEFAAVRQQITYQLKLVGTNFQALGAALAQGGFLNLIGGLVVGLNKLLTTVTSIIGVFNKLPGPVRDILAVMLEVGGALKLLRRLDAGAHLPAALGGTFLRRADTTAGGELLTTAGGGRLPPSAAETAARRGTFLAPSAEYQASRAAMLARGGLSGAATASALTAAERAAAAIPVAARTMAGRLSGVGASLAASIGPLDVLLAAGIGISLLVDHLDKTAKRDAQTTSLTAVNPASLGASHRTARIGYEHPYGTGNILSQALELNKDALTSSFNATANLFLGGNRTSQLDKNQAAFKRQLAFIESTQRAQARGELLDTATIAQRIQRGTRAGQTHDQQRAALQAGVTEASQSYQLRLGAAGNDKAKNEAAKAHARQFLVDVKAQLGTLEAARGSVGLALAAITDAGSAKTAATALGSQVLLHGPTARAGALAVREAQKDRRLLAAARGDAKEQAGLIDAINKEQAIFEQVQSLLDGRAQLAAKRARDPVAAAKVTLARINDKIRAAAGVYARNSQQMIDLLNQQADAQQAAVTAELSRFQSTQQLTAAKLAATTTNQGAILSFALTQARQNAAKVGSVERGPQGFADRNAAQANIYTQQAALRDYNTQQAKDAAQKAKDAAQKARADAQALTQARSAYAQAGLDPANQPALDRLKIREAQQLARLNTTPAERLQSAADIKSGKAGLARDIQQQKLTTIEFDASIERISQDTEIARLKSLLRQIKNNQQLKRQVQKTLFDLQKQTGDTSSELAVGNIKLPTIYDIRRIARQGVNTAPQITQNNVVALNISRDVDVAKVADVLDGHFASATKSSLRSAGLI